MVIKLDHNGYIPEDIDIKEARKHERHSMDKFSFEEGEITAFDKGFSDYKFFATLYKKKTYFVTRLKKNARYEVENTLPSNHENIRYDKLINFTGYTSKKRCPMQLRLIKSYDPETDNEIDIITNNFKLSAKTINVPDLPGNRNSEMDSQAGSGTVACLLLPVNLHHTQTAAIAFSFKQTVLLQSAL